MNQTRRRLVIGSAALACLGRGAAEETGDDKRPDARPPPGRLDPEALAGFEEMHPARRELVAAALRLGWEHRLDRYIFGSADPERGGLDCSGATYYLLRSVGLDPPRTSAGQHRWVSEDGRLTEIPRDVRSPDDPAFAALQPGDLLFWAGTYEPADGRASRVTHVQLYLGQEERDGDHLHVMAGSTDGRTYRGTRRCGYGVYDFRLPRPGSKAAFAGFGTPPGLVEGGRGGAAQS